MFRRATLAALLVTLTGAAHAATNIDTLGNINLQSDFRLLSGQDAIAKYDQLDFCEQNVSRER